MKKSTIKKIIVFALCCVIVLSGAVPVTAVVTEVNPIIYIADMEDIDLYEYPDTLSQKVVLDTDSASFKSTAAKMFGGVLLSQNNGINNSIPYVVNGINSIMQPIACNASGNSRNSAIGPLCYELPISQYPDDPINTPVITAIADAAASKTDKNHFYVFLYDWRLDPNENAESLREYIDNVIAQNRSGSVSLICAGYGGVVANAYLYSCRSHAAQNVFSCVFLDSPLMGNAVMGDIMKGKIAKTSEDDSGISAALGSISGEDRGNALIKYLNDDPNNVIFNLTQWLLGSSKEDQLFGAFAKILFMSILQNEGSGEKIAKLYNNFVLLADENIYSTCLREYLRNMLGLWALVPTKDYKAAYDFLFGDETVNYEFSQKLVGVRAVVDNTATTLKYAQADGIKMYVVANYGRQILPATVSIDDVSDGIESAKYASAGAVTAECGTGWSYTVNCGNTTAHKHRSPDNDIEASTCALPENTWFIKDLKHMDFQYATAAQFVVWLATSNTQRNVWETTAYPQYLVYSKTSKTVSAYSDNSDLAGSDYMLGDTDLDGAVTAGDARTVLRFSVGLETPSKMMRIVADVDADKEITPADARLVLRYSVGLISAFPVEEN